MSTTIATTDVDPVPNHNPAPDIHPGDTHPTPAYEAHSSISTLKQRITDHYNIASDYYHSLWGQHIHHGLFIPPSLTKEEAQVNLIKYLLSISGLRDGATVLDVGCGIGGTSRYLANEKGCRVIGITISSKQVEIANRLSLAESHSPPADPTTTPIPIGTRNGSVYFLELDAESMLSYFQTKSSAPNTATTTSTSTSTSTSTNNSSTPPNPNTTNTDDPPINTFDCIWISEALSHIPSKETFFSSSFTLLSPSGRLVIADWFKSPNLTPQTLTSTIAPIEDGMLLPPLHTMGSYVILAQDAGFTLTSGPHDVSADVAKTWDISWSLVSSPSLWAFAISQGRDGLAFLQAFRAMRRGYAEGSFRYGVMCFGKSKKELEQGGVV